VPARATCSAPTSATPAFPTGSADHIRSRVADRDRRVNAARQPSTPVAPPRAAPPPAVSLPRARVADHLSRCRDLLGPRWPASSTGERRFPGQPRRPPVSRSVTAFWPRASFRKSVMPRDAPNDEPERPATPARTAPEASLWRSPTTGLRAPDSVIWTCREARRGGAGVRVSVTRVPQNDAPTHRVHAPPNAGSMSHTRVSRHHACCIPLARPIALMEDGTHGVTGS
jgi:hypothetical protein